MLRSRCRLCGMPFLEPNWASLRAEWIHHFTVGMHLPKGLDRWSAHGVQVTVGSVGHDANGGQDACPP